MAFNFKKVIIDSFLQMCETTPIKKIKIADLVERTGVSTQTFYNHFKSKNDLIHYIYRELVVIPQPPAEDRLVDLYPQMCFFYKNLLRYKFFILQMCKAEGESNIKQCIETLELQWSDTYFQKFFPMDGPLTEEKFTANFDSYGFIGVTLWWIRSGMKEPPEILARGRTECLPLLLERCFQRSAHPDDAAPNRQAFLRAVVPASPPRKAEKLIVTERKMLFSRALVQLCNTKLLSKITVNDLIEQTGSGRQTFYRYFLDKNDLIQWTFKNCIFYRPAPGENFRTCWQKYYARLIEYRDFLSQADGLTGEDSLLDYMVMCEISWCEEQYYRNYGTATLPKDIAYAVQFYAHGSVSSILQWAWSGQEIRAETLAEWTLRCIPVPMYVYPFVQELFDSG